MLPPHRRRPCRPARSSASTRRSDPRAKCPTSSRRVRSIPSTRCWPTPQGPSAGTIDSGTWTATGANVTVVSAAPHEGAGGYIVSADSALLRRRRAQLPRSPRRPRRPPRRSTSRVPALTPGLGHDFRLDLRRGQRGDAPASTTTASVLVAHERPARRDGSRSMRRPRTGSGGTVTVSGVPAQTSSALYYLSVRAWNSSDPSGTLQRQWYPTAVDLRSSAERLDRS